MDNNKLYYKIQEDILLKQSGCTLDKEEWFHFAFTPYRLVRILTGRVDLLLYADMLARYQHKLTPEQFYRLAYYLIPKQKSSFIKFKSYKKKETKKKETDEEEFDVD